MYRNPPSGTKGNPALSDRRTLPSQTRHRVNAEYVIGCEGARSLVREAIGSQYAGSDDSRLNFECRRHPNDSVTTSLWLDSHGKALSCVLLNLEIETDLPSDALLSRGSDKPMVALEEGLVRGRRLEHGVLSYSGIPFASPPIGSSDI